MLRKIVHEVGDIKIIMEREETLCSLTVSRGNSLLIELNMIENKDMRAIVKVLSDSPFIYSALNKE